VRWTRWVGLSAGVLGLAGCGYGYGYQFIGVQARYSTDSRPQASYFCYDCHGYRYFDPYYDFCSGRGYRYQWDRHPEAVAIYRERYVRIKESHPEYGRYRYREGYRAAARYREPRDYEVGRGRVMERATPPGRSRSKDREKDGGSPGRKERKGDSRKGPRDHGSRLSLPGGER
jgi:hypothetical protein